MIDTILVTITYAVIAWLALTILYRGTNDLVMEYQSVDNTKRMIWKDTCLQWKEHTKYWDGDVNTYYDLLASFVPKTQHYTMTAKGILDIGNGGLKRTVR